MDLGLGGRVAIVGGSSKGMGKAVAMGLARGGASVAICSRHGDELEQTAAEIRAAVATDLVQPVVADLSAPGDVDRLVGEVTARWGRVDIVVVNLGGPPPGQPTELSDDDWQGAFGLGFYSAVGLCRRVHPLMRGQERGRIISILSLSVRQPEDNLALSTVARTAVAAFMKTLSNEVAREGITVNTVLPGSIATERLQGVWEMQARFPRPGPGQRQGRPAGSGPGGPLRRPEGGGRSHLLPRLGEGQLPYRAEYPHRRRPEPRDDLVWCRK